MFIIPGTILNCILHLILCAFCIYIFTISEPGNVWHFLLLLLAALKDVFVFTMPKRLGLLNLVFCWNELAGTRICLKRLNRQLTTDTKAESCLIVFPSSLYTYFLYFYDKLMHSYHLLCHSLPHHRQIAINYDVIHLFVFLFPCWIVFAFPNNTASNYYILWMKWTRVILTFFSYNA